MKVSSTFKLSVCAIVLAVGMTVYAQRKPLKVADYAIQSKTAPADLVISDVFYGVDYDFSMAQNMFSLRGHKLCPARERQKAFATVDGHILWGDRWETFGHGVPEPMAVLRRLTFQRGREAFDFPANALFNVFYIRLDGESQLPPRWVNEKTGAMSIQLRGGDGGEAYFIIFTVSREGKQGTRTIFLGESRTPIERKTFKLTTRSVRI